MKKFEIVAFSKDEAKQKAKEMGLNVVSEVTQTWKNKKSPVSDKDMYNFAIDIFSKKRLNDVEGVGLMITIDPANADTRERPYQINSFKNEGKRHTKRVVEIRSEKNGTLLGVAENKKEAEKVAKALITKYREDVIATVVYKVIENKDILFKGKYTPSINAKEGKYIVFGNLAKGF